MSRPLRALMRSAYRKASSARFRSTRARDASPGARTAAERIESASARPSEPSSFEVMRGRLRKRHAFDPAEHSSRWIRPRASWAAQSPCRAPFCAGPANRAPRSLRECDRRICSSHISGRSSDFAIFTTNRQAGDRTENSGGARSHRGELARRSTCASSRLAASEGERRGVVSPISSAGTVAPRPNCAAPPPSPPSPPRRPCRRDFRAQGFLRRARGVVRSRCRSRRPRPARSPPRIPHAWASSRERRRIERNPAPRRVNAQILAARRGVRQVHEEDLVEAALRINSAEAGDVVRRGRPRTPGSSCQREARKAPARVESPRLGIARTPALLDLVDHSTQGASRSAVASDSRKLSLRLAHEFVEQGGAVEAQQRHVEDPAQTLRGEALPIPAPPEGGRPSARRAAAPSRRTRRSAPRATP